MTSCAADVQEQGVFPVPCKTIWCVSANRSILESKHLNKRVGIAARSAAYDYYVADSQAVMISKSVDVVYALTEFECESTTTIGKLSPALGVRA
jgi:hypothetical protein